VKYNTAIDNVIHCSKTCGLRNYKIVVSRVVHKS